MKKVLIIALVLMLALPLVSMAAQKIDLSTYTVEELIALKTDVVGELMNRKEIKTAKIPTGDYIIGVDFPAGVYSVTTNEFLVTIVINEYEQLYTVAQDAPIGKITLKDGDAFKCTSAIELKVYAGISFD